MKNNPDLIVMANPPKMTRQHFELIAETISNLAIDEKYIRIVAVEFADMLKRTNPVFDKHRFILAAESPGYRAKGRGVSQYDRSNPPVRGRVFGKQVLEVRYVHAEDKCRYIHKFGNGVQMENLADGSVRLFHPKHRIWEDM